MIDSLPERITRHIWPEPNSGCWLWGGRTDPHGYGSARMRRRQLRVHRLVFEAVHGTIAVGLCVLHHCDNPPCCNPAHLFLGTQADNMADMRRKGRQSRHLPGPGGGMRRLTPAQVMDIRRRRTSGEMVAAVAAVFGVHPKTISKISAGRIWAHLPLVHRQPTVALMRARGGK